MIGLDHDVIKILQYQPRVSVKSLTRHTVVQMCSAKSKYVVSYLNCLDADVILQCFCSQNCINAKVEIVGDLRIFGIIFALTINYVFF